MAAISLRGVRHAYIDRPKDPADWALKRFDTVFEDGGAYALLGPSGCGKTTLLNIISGIIQPTEGRVVFGEEDVTDLPSDKRHIAQVFQFPVVYDTMSVYDNLAFPLRNRGMDEATIDERVRTIADMLELTPTLKRRASGLTADGKQKISLGRGLVRTNVNVVMFDEPLTVIDPHLKWQLRSKLKELHQRIRTTMIYVTHDQTEALTFAERVVVMNDGEVVQVGTPIELFERPHHTFVGHFIGSPGMNFFDCQVADGAAVLAGRPVKTANPVRAEGGRLQLGVRPEFVSLAPDGIPVRITHVADAGRFSVVEAMSDVGLVRLLVQEGDAIPVEAAHVRFDPARTLFYSDGWLVQ